MTVRGTYPGFKEIFHGLPKPFRTVRCKAVGLGSIQQFLVASNQQRASYMGVKIPKVKKAKC